MEHSYKHYLLGERVPVRIVFNKEGHEIGAEVPNRQVGKLVKDATYLGRVYNSEEVEEITPEEFQQRSMDILSCKMH